MAECEAYGKLATHLTRGGGGCPTSHSAASGIGNIPMAECVAYGELATHLTRGEGGCPMSHSFPGGVIEGQQ